MTAAKAVHCHECRQAVAPAQTERCRACGLLCCPRCFDPTNDVCLGCPAPPEVAIDPATAPYPVDQGPETDPFVPIGHGLAIRPTTMRNRVDPSPVEYGYPDPDGTPAVRPAVGPIQNTHPTEDPYGPRDGASPEADSPSEGNREAGAPVSPSLPALAQESAPSAAREPGTAPQGPEGERQSALTAAITSEILVDALGKRTAWTVTVNDQRTWESLCRHPASFKAEWLGMRVQRGRVTFMRLEQARAALAEVAP